MPYILQYHHLYRLRYLANTFFLPCKVQVAHTPGTKLSKSTKIKAGIKNSNSYIQLQVFCFPAREPRVQSLSLFDDGPLLRFVEPVYLKVYVTTKGTPLFLLTFIFFFLLEIKMICFFVHSIFYLGNEHIDGAANWCHLFELNFTKCCHLFHKFQMSFQ